MKKIANGVKIVLAIFFLIGGLGNIGNNTDAAIFGIVLSLIFIAWIIFGLKKQPKSQKKFSTPEYVYNTEQSSPVSNDENKRANNKSSEIRPNVIIPSKIGTAWKKYYYPDEEFEPMPESEELAHEMQKTNDWKLGVNNDGAFMTLTYHGLPFGIVKNQKRADMLKDWIERNEPLLIFLSHFGASNTVAMAFYRDDEARLSYRESTIVKLTRYSNEDAQLSISILENREPLDFDEEDEETIAISDIGYLPKSAAKKYAEEGAAGVFLDHVDYDDEKDKYIPYVKIYW